MLTTLSIILITLSCFLILEGLIIVLFTKPAIKTLKKLIKKPKDLKSIGFIELILGLIILFFVLL